MPKIQLRHDTATNWATANPVLLEGEAGYETDTNKMKIGDGTTNYNSLPYLASGLFDNKVDLDASNLSNTGKSTIASLPMPSDTYIDLTLNASGSTYTAPANGWVYLQKDNGDSNHYCQIRNETSMLSAWASRYTGSTNNGCYLPIHKGDIYTVIYNATGATVYFRFIYAQGSESEAQ